MASSYIHGFSRIEQSRLSLMQGIINGPQLAAMNLAGCQQILDVGSGLGQFSRAMAGEANAHVLGIESNRSQIVHARRLMLEDADTSDVEFRQGEAQALPIKPEERGSFDLAHARFLLEHVVDPLAVVTEMVSAVKPGGRIVLIDDDHELLRLWPQCPSLAYFWQAYWQSYLERGLDPLVGRRLPSLLFEAGARPTRVDTIFFGAVKGDGRFEAVVDNLQGILEGAADGLLQAKNVGSQAVDEALAALARWRQHAAAVLWYSLPMAEGARPAT